MAAPLKLTPELLRRIVREERAKVVAEAKKNKKGMRESEISAKAREVDADEMAGTVPEAEDQYKGLSEGVDALKRLAMTEARLLRQLRSIRETKARIKNSIKRSV